MIVLAYVLAVIGSWFKKERANAGSLKSPLETRESEFELLCLSIEEYHLTCHWLTPSTANQSQHNGHMLW